VPQSWPSRQHTKEVSSVLTVFPVIKFIIFESYCLCLPRQAAIPSRMEFLSLQRYASPPVQILKWNVYLLLFQGLRPIYYLMLLLKTIATPKMNLLSHGSKYGQAACMQTGVICIASRPRAKARELMATPPKFRTPIILMALQTPEVVTILMCCRTVGAPK